MEEPVNKEHHKDPETIARYLTYMSCSGKVTEETPQIAELWKKVVKKYSEQMGSKKPASIVEIKNKFGASHFKNREKDTLFSNSSLAELALVAAESLAFGKRFSHEGIILSDSKKTETISYSDLESLPGAGDELIGKNINARLEFRDEKNKITGTILEVDNTQIKIFQRVENANLDDKHEEVPLITITRDSGQDKTIISLPIDSPTSSNSTFTVKGSKTFWTIREGLMFSDVYPYPQSVKSFYNKIENI